MHGYTHDKDKYLRRLRRIEGQVRGLQRMVDEDKYCIDILTQVSAATRALESVALGLLEEHLGHCVAQAIAEGGSASDEKVKEAAEAIARLVRSLPAAKPQAKHVRGALMDGTMSTTTYAVTGMSCDHCVHAVTSGLGALAGVSAVRVDLLPDGASRVTVTSDRPLDGAAVGAALDEAGGYELAAG
jgi:DNA-binding FrmR family transcriptional regulator/copper chaperone CopZ